MNVETPGKIRKGLLKVLFILIIYYFMVPPFFIPLHGRITSHFFFRQNPSERILPSIELHNGLDIAAPLGTEIKASKSGVVKTAGFNQLAGNYVIIEHWLGFSTFYAHMSEITVREGDFVFKGLSTIGKVGSTGRSTGPHLHFEVRWMKLQLPPEVFCIFDSARLAIWNLIFSG